MLFRSKRSIHDVHQDDLDLLRSTTRYQQQQQAQQAQKEEEAESIMDHRETNDEQVVAEPHHQWYYAHSEKNKDYMSTLTCEQKRYMMSGRSRSVPIHLIHNHLMNSSLSNNYSSGSGSNSNGRRRDSGSSSSHSTLVSSSSSSSLSTSPAFNNSDTSHNAAFSSNNNSSSSSSSNNQQSYNSRHPPAHLVIGTLPGVSQIESRAFARRRSSIDELSFSFSTACKTDHLNYPLLPPPTALEGGGMSVSMSSDSLTSEDGDRRRIRRRVSYTEEMHVDRMNPSNGRRDSIATSEHSFASSSRTNSPLTPLADDSIAAALRAYSFPHGSNDHFKEPTAASYLQSDVFPGGYRRNSATEHPITEDVILPPLRNID